MNIAALQQENAELNATVANLTSELDSHKQQLDWFQRQLFGRKSEKRLSFDTRELGNLLFGLGVEAPPEKDDIPTATVVIHSDDSNRVDSQYPPQIEPDASPEANAGFSFQDNRSIFPRNQETPQFLNLSGNAV